MILDLPAIREQWETNGHLTEVQQEWLLTEVDRLTRERDEAQRLRNEAIEAASELHLIGALLSDRSEAGTYAKVEGLEAERDALAALVVESCGLLKLLDRTGAYRAIDDYLDRAKCADAFLPLHPPSGL